MSTELKDVGALVERLRNERPTNMMTVLALHLEAAALIQSQAARIVELERKLAVADKALEPFSVFAGPLFERNFNEPDTVERISAADGGVVSVTAGHFFAARRARETIGGRNEQD